MSDFNQINGRKRLYEECEEMDTFPAIKRPANIPDDVPNGMTVKQFFNSSQYPNNIPATTNGNGMLENSNMNRMMFDRPVHSNQQNNVPQMFGYGRYSFVEGNDHHIRSNQQNNVPQMFGLGQYSFVENRRNVFTEESVVSPYSDIELQRMIRAEEAVANNPSVFSPELIAYHQNQRQERLLHEQAKKLQLEAEQLQIRAQRLHEQAQQVQSSIRGGRQIPMYNPDLNSVENPFYYETNRMLYELYTARKQRNT